MKYKIVLVPFPFDDLTQAKPRPAVCLTNAIGVHRHIVVAFITSQVPAAPMTTDIILDSNRADFQQTGLLVASTLRLHRLVTVNRSIIQRELGRLPLSVQTDVQNKLRKLFDLS